MPLRAWPIIGPPFLRLAQSTPGLFLARILAEFSRDNLMHVAAGIAFYGLLALFPGINAAISLTALLVPPDLLLAELTSFAEIMPHEAAQIILNQAAQVALSEHAQFGLSFILSLGIAVYSSSKGMQALMNGLNMAHNEIETRSYIRRTLTKLILTMMMIAGLIMGVGMTVILPSAFAMAGFDTSNNWITALRWPIMGALTVIGLRILYWFGPCHGHSHGRSAGGLLTWGTVVAATGWVACSIGFSFYVQSFAVYSKTFGALGGVIVLLMWLWISGLVILIGAEIDAALEWLQERKNIPMKTLGK
jgi:membrane protein